MGGPAAERPRRTLGVWKVLAWVALGLVVAAGGLVLATMGWEWTAQDRPITEVDRAAVVTAARLGEWLHDDDVHDPSGEVWSKKRFLDGSLELTYEHDGDGVPGAAWVVSELWVDRKLSDALLNYEMQALVLKNLLSGEHVRTEERSDLIAWGDSSTSLLLHGAEGPIGNAFVVRKGRRVMASTFFGVYFDDPDAFAEFLAPVFAAAEKAAP